MTLTIPLIISGITPAAVTMLSLTDAGGNSIPLNVPPTFTNTSGNDWNYAFNGTSFQYTFVWNFTTSAGAVYGPYTNVFQPGGSAGPTLNGAPFYATQTDLINFWGMTSIKQWSNVDAAAGFNAIRINLALLYADGEINAQFSAGGIFTVAPNLSLGPISQNLTNNWACVLGGAWLYESRAGRDDKFGNLILPKLERVMRDMQLASSDTKSAMGFDASRRWPVANSPIAYAASPWNAWSPPPMLGGGYSRWGARGPID